jgi:hypothetical protein
MKRYHTSGIYIKMIRTYMRFIIDYAKQGDDSFNEMLNDAIEKCQRVPGFLDFARINFDPDRNGHLCATLKFRVDSDDVYQEQP